MDKESLDEEGLADFEVRAGYGLLIGDGLCTGAGWHNVGKWDYLEGQWGWLQGYVDWRSSIWEVRKEEQAGDKD